VKASPSQRPPGPKRAGLLDGEGDLLLQVPGQPVRSLGAPRRFTLAASALWLAVVVAGLALGWIVRGLV